MKVELEEMLEVTMMRAGVKRIPAEEKILRSDQWAVSKSVLSWNT